MNVSIILRTLQLSYSMEESISERAHVLANGTFDIWLLPRFLGYKLFEIQEANVPNNLGIYMQIYYINFLIA